MRVEMARVRSVSKALAGELLATEDFSIDLQKNNGILEVTVKVEDFDMALAEDNLDLYRERLAQQLRQTVGVALEERKPRLRKSA